MHFPIVYNVCLCPLTKMYVREIKNKSERNTIAKSRIIRSIFHGV